MKTFVLPTILATAFICFFIFVMHSPIGIAASAFVYFGVIGKAVKERRLAKGLPERHTLLD